jgi:hypothetical protein
VSSPTEPLSARQERAIFALIREGTVRRAAKSARVAESTLYRWLKDPAFRGRYDYMRREAAAFGLAVAQEGIARAFRTLRQEQKTDRKSADRSRAANYFLRNALKGIEQADLLDRLKTLEELIRAICEGNPDPPGARGNQPPPAGQLPGALPE